MKKLFECTSKLSGVHTCKRKQNYLKTLSQPKNVLAILSIAIIPQGKPWLSAIRIDSQESTAQKAAWKLRKLLFILSIKQVPKHIKSQAIFTTENLTHRIKIVELRWLHSHK